MGETGTSVIGGVVGGAFLGPQGKNLGQKIGMFVGKEIDWHSGSGQTSIKTSVN